MHAFLGVAASAAFVVFIVGVVGLCVGHLHWARMATRAPLAITAGGAFVAAGAIAAPASHHKVGAAQVSSTLAALSIACGLVLGGCAHASTVHTGDALIGVGPTENLVSIIPSSQVRIGDRFGFAFPELENVSNTAVQINSVSLVKPLVGTVVAKYVLLSSFDTSGIFLSDNLGLSGKGIYLSHHDYLPDRVTLSAKAPPRYYPAIVVKVIGRTSTDGMGCKVNYSEGNKNFSQTFPCDFRID